MLGSAADPLAVDRVAHGGLHYGVQHWGLVPSWGRQLSGHSSPANGERRLSRLRQRDRLREHSEGAYRRVG